MPRIELSIDPTESLLATRAGTTVEARAGDLCSLLGIVGAATLVINHRAIHLPAMEHAGGRLVLGSMAAAAVDTLIQSRNVAVDRGDGSEARGNPKSHPGTIAYAATGLVPAASLAAYVGLHRHPSHAQLAGAALLALNGAILGYELVSRGPDIVRGEENLSGYGSLLASLGGFVVAQRMLR